MPTGFFEDDTSREYSESELDDCYAEISGTRKANEDFLLRQITDVQKRCRVICVEFRTDAELIFFDDSKRHVRAMLRKRSAADIGSGEIIEGLSDMLVVRDGKMQKSLDLIMYDQRWQTVSCMRDVLAMQEEKYDDLDSENDLLNIVKRKLQSVDINQKPPPNFLLFLSDLLQAGETDGLSSIAEAFIEAALYGEQAKLYGEYFDSKKMELCQQMHSQRRNKTEFVKCMGIPVWRITCIRELNELLSPIKNTDLYKSMILCYLRALDDHTEQPAIESVVVQLMQSHSIEEVRILAQKTLFRLGWTWKDGKWINIKRQSGSCQRNPTSV